MFSWVSCAFSYNLVLCLLIVLIARAVEKIVAM